MRHSKIAILLGKLEDDNEERSKDPAIDSSGINGVQSWISPPHLMAPKHCKTSILGAVIVSERGFLEPH